MIQFYRVREWTHSYFVQRTRMNENHNIITRCYTEDFNLRAERREMSDKKYQTNEPKKPLSVDEKKSDFIRSWHLRAKPNT